MKRHRVRRHDGPRRLRSLPGLVSDFAWRRVQEHPCVSTNRGKLESGKLPPHGDDWFRAILTQPTAGLHGSRAVSMCDLDNVNPTTELPASGERQIMVFLVLHPIGVVSLARSRKNPRHESRASGEGEKSSAGRPCQSGLRIMSSRHGSSPRNVTIHPLFESGTSFSPWYEGRTYPSPTHLHSKFPAKVTPWRNSEGLREDLGARNEETRSTLALQKPARAVFSELFLDEILEGLSTRDQHLERRPSCGGREAITVRPHLSLHRSHSGVGQ